MSMYNRQWFLPLFENKMNLLVFKCFTIFGWKTEREENFQLKCEKCEVSFILISQLIIERKLAGSPPGRTGGERSCLELYSFIHVYFTIKNDEE